MNQRLAEDLAVGDVLAGGGEMGALTRAFDWSSTPLGPVSEWPQSLRTAVGIVRNSSSSTMTGIGPASDRTGTRRRWGSLAASVGVRSGR